MYKITIEDLYNPENRVDGIIDVRSQDLRMNERFTSIFDGLIQKYNEIKTRKRSLTGDFESQISNQMTLERGLSSATFTLGLPNIKNSCYINSVLQSLKIVFDRFSIRLNSVGIFSSSVKKLIESLQITRGVKLQDYNDFTSKLRQENWARGDTRDAKEFFTFIIGKLKSENNPSIENLFTTNIEKEHTINCKYTRKQDKKVIADSVTIINFTGNSISECIQKKIDYTGIINDYPCSFCQIKERCEEKIVPISRAKVNVVYTDPRNGILSSKLQISQDIICWISFTYGQINHFKVHSNGKVLDDDREYNEAQISYQTGYAYQNNQELTYLIFLIPRNHAYN